MTGTVKTDRQTNRAKHIQRFKDRIRTVRMRTDGELDGSTFGWFWVLKNSDHKTSPSFRCLAFVAAFCFWVKISRIGTLLISEEEQIIGSVWSQ